jgi:hypothetical protein
LRPPNVVGLADDHVRNRGRTMKRILAASVVATALVVVQAYPAPAQAPVVVPPGSTVIVPGPAVVTPGPAAVAPAPAVVAPAPAASPATVTVITTTVEAPPFCGGAYRPDAGTNFGGCSR